MNGHKLKLSCKKVIKILFSYYIHSFYFLFSVFVNFFFFLFLLLLAIVLNVKIFSFSSFTNLSLDFSKVFQFYLCFYTVLLAVFISFFLFSHHFMCKLLLRRIANCYEECHFVSTEIASNLTFDLLSFELINYKRKQKKNISNKQQQKIISLLLA